MVLLVSLLDESNTMGSSSSSKRHSPKGKNTDSDDVPVRPTKNKKKKTVSSVSTGNATSSNQVWNQTGNTYVNDPTNNAPPVPSRQKPENQKGNKKLRALYDYRARCHDEISFNKDDKLELVSHSLDDDWCVARNTKTKQSGYIPSNYVVFDDNSIESQDWWYGSMDRPTAVKQLMWPGNQVGTFIVRYSSDNSAYALSVLDRDVQKQQLVVRHFLIRKMDDGTTVYMNPKQKFSSLQEFVNACQKPVKMPGRVGVVLPVLTAAAPREVLPIPFKELEVKQSDIILGEKLGSGQFGEVYAGKFRNVVDVAVKTLKSGAMTTDQFIEEAETMHKLRHKRLVQLLGVCSNPLYIITERMANGSLLDYLHQDLGKTIKVPTLIDMATQVTDGMSYLEAKNFIHRDLRAANILAAENFIVKVADFGLARVLDCLYDDVYEVKPDTKFPVRWTAPEAFISGSVGSFSVKSDVWSFGVLLYEMVTYGLTPYQDVSSNVLVKNHIAKGYRLPNPNGMMRYGGLRCECPDWLYDIMRQCWNAKPEQRPTFESLKYLFDDYPVSTEMQYAEPTA